MCASRCRKSGDSRGNFKGSSHLGGGRNRPLTAARRARRPRQSSHLRGTQTGRYDAANEAASARCSTFITRKFSIHHPLLSHRCWLMFCSNPRLPLPLLRPGTSPFQRASCMESSAAARPGTAPPLPSAKTAGVSLEGVHARRDSTHAAGSSAPAPRCAAPRSLRRLLGRSEPRQRCGKRNTQKHHHQNRARKPRRKTPTP